MDVREDIRTRGKFEAMIEIDRDDPARADVRQVLSEHLADMFATSPAESVHALDHSALSGPSIVFWTAREDGDLLGCGALKHLESPPGSGSYGEIKSMRTTAKARERGVATLMLRHILDDARNRDLERVFLETGSEDYFAPARRLYVRHGFPECPALRGLRSGSQQRVHGAAPVGKDSATELNDFAQLA